MRKKFNPTIAVLMMLAVGLILTFATKIWLNIFVFIVCLLYLTYERVNWKKLGIALLIAFPFALGSWLSFMAFSHNLHAAWLYGTRIYVYFVLGASVSLLYRLHDLLLSLHQHFHLSNTFVYGILTASGMLRDVQNQIKKIRISANMRGETLHWWNPMLYLKIIVSCLNWSDNLSTSLVVQGFSDNYPRTELYYDSISKSEWLILASIVLVILLLALL